MKIEIKTIGNSDGPILPRELMRRLDPKRGRTATQHMALCEHGAARPAAAYAFGHAKNHAFVDGNKRIAFMSVTVILRKNGIPVAAGPAGATTIALSPAAG